MSPRGETGASGPGLQAWGSRMIVPALVGNDSIEWQRRSGASRTPYSWFDRGLPGQEWLATRPVSRPRLMGSGMPAVE